ncbi:MAG: class I SAM-dependent methyltransferase [Sorangiineae bacterium]|nr:class I SAM-dependent methyltransferase [Polyangiaceae bacterium]MEB2321012.1 class I SAM-dependent methyltransferase [Sorangiineae bacterium]
MTRAKSRRPPGAVRPGALGVDDVGRAGDAATLAHYADPTYYELAYRARQADVDYYVKLASAVRGPVLEYGAGSGRVTLALARSGRRVVATDLSAPMLERLRAALADEPPAVRRRVELVRGDMRTLRLERRFPLVIAAFNTVMHLYDRVDFEAFLARVREHSTARGRLVFDVAVPHGEDLARDPERRYGAPRFRHPTTGELVRYAERFEYDPVRQLLLVHLEFTPEGGGAPWSVPLVHRQWFPRELEALLYYAGFGDIAFTADFTAAPPDQTVDSLVVTCRPLPRGRAGIRGARRLRARPRVSSL